LATFQAHNHWETVPGQANGPYLTVKLRKIRSKVGRNPSKSALGAMNTMYGIRLPFPRTATSRILSGIACPFSRIAEFPSISTALCCSSADDQIDWIPRLPQCRVRIPDGTDQLAGRFAQFLPAAPWSKGADNCP
jgi:hypothetical protein